MHAEVHHDRNGSEDAEGMAARNNARMSHSCATNRTSSIVLMKVPCGQGDDQPINTCTQTMMGEANAAQARRSRSAIHRQGWVICRRNIQMASEDAQEAIYRVSHKMCSTTGAKRWTEIDGSEIDVRRDQ